MTSSLVGSEMCIRDSGLDNCSDLCQVADNLEHLAAEKWPGTSLNIRPVSYTHLTLPTICSV
eukprot:9609059-Prorocentrum_lima.AAC.1